MKLCIILISCAVAINAEPTENFDEKDSKVVPIVASENQVDGFGGKYIYSYESGDGTKASQRGELKHIDTEHAGEAVEGEFSYKDQDGQTISLTYTADENGYQPKGDHLPTPPPIPPAIVKALAYLATLPPSKEDFN